MPMNRALYPDDWEAIALAIKQAANWQCQECARPCRRFGESIEDFAARLADDYDPHENYWIPQLYEELGKDEICHSQRFTLTVAHLDQNPSNNDPTNLKALCTGCHLRHDTPFRPSNRTKNLERWGQLNLFAVGAEQCRREVQDAS